MDQIDRILAQWRTERPDLDVEPMGTLGRMGRLYRHLREAMDKVFMAHGLNRASFDVLATLRRSGAPFALTPSALMEWTMVTSGTMTNRIDRLVAAGLVERQPNPDDKRGFLIGLTASGHALIDEAVAAHVANQHRLTEVLTEAERQVFDKLVAKWLSALEEGGQGHT